MRSLPAAEFPEPGVVHVHGLGVDPGDGTLYAATHSGLFRIPEDGPASRVANRYADVMGFDVVGPEHFLGSGHPDFRELDEPLVGLLESTDAGRTWRRVSLYGEADLHAIEVAHEAIYAYDSTSETFMVSTDGGQSWDRRSHLVISDLAVSPLDPDLVLATTAGGLRRSTDGGRSWQALPDVPRVAVVVWGAELLGVGPDGGVHVSTDAGTTWTARGNAGGTPEAVTLDGEVLVVAVADVGIVRSDDGGRSFTTRYASGRE